jgi:hypothetical protein
MSEMIKSIKNFIFTLTLAATVFSSSVSSMNRYQSSKKFYQAVAGMMAASGSAVEHALGENQSSIAQMVRFLAKVAHLAHG